MRNAWLEYLQAYYVENPERDRLTKDNIHRVEFDATCAIIDHYFPDTFRVLDCCAGSGEYSFYLAKSGHSVVAGDLLDVHVKLIRSNPLSNLLKSIYCGNVLSLNHFSDNSYDAVICFGAFYHLANPSDRKRALNEINRVLRNDGILIITYLIRNKAYIEKIDSVSSLKYDQVCTLFCGFTNGEFISMINESNAFITETHNRTAGVYNIEKINNMNEGELASFLFENRDLPFEEMCIGHEFRAIWVGRKKKCQ